MAKRSVEPQVGVLPVRRSLGKVMGPQDFSGQDSGEPSSSPEAEVRNNHDGGTAGVNARAIHDISNPDRSTELHVLDSTDPRLHLSRMSGKDPKTPARYRGPDKRKI